MTRARVLILQSIITVENYEYIFAFHFTQDVSINYGVRLIGILSTTTTDVGASAPYGAVGPWTIGRFQTASFLPLN